MHTVESYTHIPTIEGRPRTEQRIVDYLRRVAEAPGLLNPAKRIVWDARGRAINRSFNSPNRN